MLSITLLVAVEKGESTVQRRTDTKTIQKEQPLQRYELKSKQEVPPPSSFNFDDVTPVQI